MTTMNSIAARLCGKQIRVTAATFAVPEPNRKT
jgi:hypothetical protein